MSDNEFFGGRRRRRGNGGDAFSPYTLFASGEQGVWYDPSDLTPEKVSWRRNLLTYSQDFENAAWTKSNASLLSNLALYSQDFDNAAWTKNGVTVSANAIAAPDSTTTADLLTSAGAMTFENVTEAVTFTGDSTKCASCYFKAGTAALTEIEIRDVTAGVARHRIRLTWSAGVPTVTSVIGTGTIYTTESLGNGWYRVLFSATGVVAANANHVRIYPTGTAQVAGTVYAWGAQAENAITPSTYTRSLATAAPIQFSDPLGGTMADKLVENTATAQHFVFAPSPTLVSGYPYAVSVYLKAGEETLASIVRLSDSAGAEFNLSAGTVGNIAAGMTASITAVGDGWYRCVVGMLGSGSTIGIQLRGRAASYTGNGVNGVFLFGAQVEQASTASAYQRITDFSSDFLATFPTHALYQESTGVTPVTALGQSVGYVFDKRLGPMGENLFGYSSWQTVGGWEATSNATLSVSNGQLVLHATGANASSGYRLTTVVGKQYQFRVRLVQDAMTGNSFMGAGSGGGSGWAANLANLNLGSTPGTYSITFTATSTDTRLSLFGSSGSVAGEILVWAEPMVREVPGNHALQATSAARPTLQARSNLLTYSEQFDNAAWTKDGATISANATTAPDGTLTADKIVESATTGLHWLYGSSVLSATTQTCSIYAKANERGRIAFGNGSADHYATFNLVNGTVISAGTGTVSGGTITEVGNGWYRCSCIITLTSVATLAVFVMNDSNQRNYAGDGSSGLFLWGIQRELGSTATTYQRIVTATDYADVGLPRNLTFDGIDDSLATAGNVDFATWTVGTRRNLLVNPTQFDAAGWASSNAVTVTANATTAPDGTATADLVIPTAVSTIHYAKQSVTLANSTTYTVSVYAKASGYNWVAIEFVTGTAFLYANVNVLTGAMGTVSGGVTATVTNVGDGFYRITATATTAATGTPGFSFFVDQADNTYTHTGNGTSGVFLWGAQLEVGSTATAFQDVGTDKVTLFSGVFKPSDDATRVIAELSVDKNSNNGVFFLNTEAAPRWYFESKGTLASSTNSGAVTTFAAPVTSVVTGLGDIGGDASIIRVNGTQLGSNTANQGTGNYGSYVLYIGRRASLSLPFNGRLFQLVIRGAATDSVTVGNAERWVGQLTGVAL